MDRLARLPCKQLNSVRIRNSIGANFLPLVSLLLIYIIHSFDSYNHANSLFSFTNMIFQEGYIYMEDVYIIQPSMDLPDFTIKNKNFMNVYLLFVILRCSNWFLGYSVTTGQMSKTYCISGGLFCVVYSHFYLPPGIDLNFRHLISSDNIDIRGETTLR